MTWGHARLHYVVVALVVACACSRDDVTLDPARVHFGERDYNVERFAAGPEHGFTLTAADDARRLLGMPSDARHLAPCPPARLLLADIDADGKRDLVFYSCGFVSIFIEGHGALSKVGPIDGRRKDRHWTRLDPKTHPGLDRLVPYIHEIDPDLE